MKATGHVFALQFDGDGESRYTCTKYGEQGMRGVVVVGDGASQILTTAGTVGAAGVAGVAVIPTVFDLRYHFRNVSDGRHVENAGADEERGDDTRPDEQAYPLTRADE